MKKMSLGLVGLAAVATLAACGNGNAQNQVDKVKKAGVLKVALSPDYPPFEFQMIKNGKNTVVGSDVDLANAIGKKLGVKVKIEAMDFNNVLTSLSSGKADIAISGITKKPSREKSVNFSEVYYTPSNYLVVKKSDLNKYTSLSDFKGKKIAAQKGSVQEGIVSGQFTGATEIGLPQIGDEINEVKGGQVQGAVIENLIAKAYVAGNPDLAISKLEVTTPKADSYGYAVASAKGSTELTKTINSVIKAELKDGTMAKNIQKNYDLSKENNK
ncbi:transporter substrate-binding domain-containing protein [Lactococcus kimchii]|nr:transporter substrate-binding domain-containing protein [Lactococcus sp. S-13]